MDPALTRLTRDRRTASVAVAVAVGLLAAATATLGCDASFVDQRPGSVAGKDGTAPADDARATDGAATTDDAEPDVGSECSAPGVFARGTFSGRGGYTGDGTAELRCANQMVELHLGSDFATSRVPDPIVVLALREAIGSNLRPAEGDLKLGALQDVTGAQHYAVPGGDGGRRYAWIYCESFGVEIARALMEDVQ